MTTACSEVKDSTGMATFALDGIFSVNVNICLMLHLSPCLRADKLAGSANYTVPGHRCVKQMNKYHCISRFHIDHHTLLPGLRYQDQR